MRPKLPAWLAPAAGDGALLDGHRNSVTFVRFLLAVAVIWAHSYAIGYGVLDPLHGLTGGTRMMGDYAVIGFFFLSGLLITRSFWRSAGTKDYFVKRVVRIYPGYVVCLVVLAFVFGPIFALIERGNLQGYFNLGPDGPWRFLLRNAYLSYAQGGVNGLLANHPRSYLFDGSLWSLSHEFKCYVILGLLGSVPLVRRDRRWMLAFALFLLVGHWALTVFGHFDQSDNPLKRLFKVAYWMELYATFFLGAACYLYREKILLRPWLAALAFVGAALCANTGLQHLLEPICVGYFWLYLSYKLPFNGFERWGDYSYGLYIYAYPVQQLAYALGAASLGLGAFFGISLLGTVPLAILSWFAVERAFLSLVRKGRKGSTPVSEPPAAPGTRADQEDAVAPVGA